MRVFLDYNLWWFLAGVACLLPAMYISVCRQALAVYSRKAFFEKLPEERHEEMEKYLDDDDEYVGSLRTLDQFLRLCMILSLIYGRLLVKVPLSEIPASFGATLLVAVALLVELTVILFVFLEILPGIAARLRPESLLVRLLPGIDLLHRLVQPVRTVLSPLVRWPVRLLGGPRDRTSAEIVEEEILSAAEEGEREGVLESRDIDMIEAVIDFGDVEVAEVMTPRTEMVCLDIDKPFEHNLERAIRCGHSRIPTFQESKDRIIGILYVKDLLRYWQERDSLVLREILRVPHFVMPTKKIGELLQEFKSQRFHIAIVRDEFGGTAGLITIEDVIEEIVGDITDEYESEAPSEPLIRIGPGLIEVDAALRVDELNDAIDGAIPEHESYDTVGGFVFSRTGKIPPTGERLEFEGIGFEVTAAEERRIRRLRLHLRTDRNGAGEGSPSPQAAKK